MSKNLQVNLKVKKYRRLLFKESDLPLVAKNWADNLQGLFSVWRNGELSDAEVATAYLIIGLQELHPNEWPIGPNLLRPEEPMNQSNAFRWIRYEGRICKWVDDSIGLFDLINSVSLKGVRLVARQSLCRWLLGEVPVKLIDHLPTPEEMLGLQANGIRPVTAFFETRDLAKVAHDGRDALSFFLHDLGHVGQFYSRPDWFRGQKRMYELLWRAHQSNLLNSKCLTNSDWSNQLEYLISDLNTHPTHFASVFWATARECFETAQAAQEFNGWRNQLFDLWEFNKPIRQAHENLLIERNASTEGLVFESLVNAASTQEMDFTTCWPFAREACRQ